MSNPQSLQLRVGVDVGSRCHSVAVGLTDGGLLEEFEIPHTAAFGVFLPILSVAPTESVACNDIASELAEFLGNGPAQGE